jgi:cation:H+ antiporter
MGIALLALVTSLPELGTVFAAMRQGLYTMAISDILGTNILNVALLLCIDLAATGEPVLSRVGTFASVGALLGIVVTGLLLIGLVERRDQTILRMGLDSAAVLIVYVGGLALLFTLR